MKLSIFTPSNDNAFLPDVYNSLKAQSDQDWEWHVVHNNGGSPFACDDMRVTQHVIFKAPEWVGALKSMACEFARGDVLMELDHDDLLTPTAVAECKAAFDDPKVGFAYSNALHTKPDWSAPERYGAHFGWKYRTTDYCGHALDEPISFDATPASVSRIWFAPNHFRAFRRSVYEQIGGYATDMRVLDDEDLMCRMYQKTKFKHIDKGLYVYRIHGQNSWLKHNKEIQDNVWRLHDKYIEPMARKWSEDNGLLCLDVGSGTAPAKGYETVDKADADHNCDLEGRWPFPDSSVGVIRSVDTFEHLKDPIHTMSECYRVLAPGGWIFAQVPSTDGRGAFQDPTHKTFWNENSWLYYTHQNWARYIGTPVRFQLVRGYTTEKNPMGVCWTLAHLCSLKDGYRPPGPINI
jgi:glycosyltransferase involved in cell wall biosynthesis